MILYNIIDISFKQQSKCSI